MENGQKPQNGTLLPMLRGEKPRQKAVTMFCLTIVFSVAIGFTARTIGTLDPTQPYAIKIMAALFLMLLILAVLDCIAAISFLKIFKQLTSSNSREDSQEVKRSSQTMEAAPTVRDPQSEQSEPTTHNDKRKDA